MPVKPAYNLLILFVLRSAGEQGSYGLDIKVKIDAAMLGEVMSVGTLYNCLSRHKTDGLIEEIGPIKSEKGGGYRVYYRITKQGLVALDQVDKVIFALQ